MDLGIVFNYFSCLMIFLKINDVFGEYGIIGTTPAPDFTCAHCGTSRSATNQKEVLDALDQFLDVRGSIHYPFDSIDFNCNRPKNISLIKYRRKCLTDYCYSVTFRDNQGIPLTLRGCADYYIAVGNLKGSYCKRLTKSLDIVECICKGGDVCSSASSSSVKHSRTEIFSFNHLLLFVMSCIASVRWRMC